VYVVISGHFCVSTEQARIYLRYKCFCVVVTDGRVLSCLGGLILTFCGLFLGYITVMMFCLVLFPDFLAGVRFANSPAVM
jgi:hypothetical protein